MILISELSAISSCLGISDLFNRPKVGERIQTRLGMFDWFFDEAMVPFLQKRLLLMRNRSIRIIRNKFNVDS